MEIVQALHAIALMALTSETLAVIFSLPVDKRTELVLYSIALSAEILAMFLWLIESNYLISIKA